MTPWPDVPRQLELPSPVGAKSGTSGNGGPIDREQAAQEIDLLFRRALRGEGGHGLSELIRFMLRFRRYSVWNAAMIRIQRLGAAAVATARKWERAGRSVNPDAIPIVILRPFGPISLVYEIADTSPPIQNQEGYDPFPVEGAVSEAVWTDTVSNALKKDAIVVELVDYGLLQPGSAIRLMTNQGGETVAGDGNTRFRVRIAKNLTLPQRYTTLAHELAHIYCGHLGSGKKDWWPNRKDHLTAGQEELEAEATAFIVAGRAEIDLASDEYLADHVHPNDLDAISIDAVLRAASRIESLTV